MIIEPFWAEMMQRLPGKCLEAFRGGRQVIEGKAPRAITSAGSDTEPAELQVQSIPESSPLVELVDPDANLRTLGEIAFRMGKEQPADVSRSVLQDLRSGGWTTLEFQYACAMLTQSAEPELVRELRYSRVIGNAVFNLIRLRPEVQAGRLHSRRQAGMIAHSRRQSIETLFDAVVIDGGSGEVLFMLKSF